MDRNAELEPTLQGVLENYSLPEGLGRTVAQQCFAAKFGSTLQRYGAPAAGAASLPWLLVAAFGGVLVGYVAAQSQDNLLHQLLMSQLYGGMGMRGGSGLEVFATSVLPASAGTLRVIALVFLILLVTRSSAWGRIYPQRVPATLVVARWLAMLAALFGITRVACGIYIASMLFGEDSISVRSSDGRFVIGIALLLDQLWWVAFWVAALGTLLVVVNLWTHSYFQPPSAKGNRLR